ncbi:hypothetical protein B484DRAFT_467523, partial [Ochromonadaceae sp. CCMP2298]
NGAVDLLGFVSGARGFIIQGAAAGDQFGYSVSVAGDVNGDGINDVIGGRSNDWLGYSVSAAGDVNGYGYADVIVGLPERGAVLVMFGRASGFGTPGTLDFASFVSGDSRGFIILGAAAGGDDLGRSVSAAGDVNGDGYADVIVGAPQKDFNVDYGIDAGAAYVILGKPSGFRTVNLRYFVSDDSAGFIIQGTLDGYSIGWSVSGAGDVNGDGYADLVVGASYASPNGRRLAGVVYVNFGKANGLTTTNVGWVVANPPGFIIEGAVAFDQFGESVSGSGDVNGDGYADVIVGAVGADPNGRTNAGAVYVIYGMASGSVDMNLLGFVSGARGFIIQGAAAGDALGRSVSAAGDVNGDGIDDIIVGARADPYGRTDAGAAYVIYGMFNRTGAVDLLGFVSGARGFIIQGAAAGDDLGRSVSGAGDVNGDGIDDVIVGAPSADPHGRVDAGAAYVIYGMASGLTTVDLLGFVSGSRGSIIQGAVTGDKLGRDIDLAALATNDVEALILPGTKAYNRLGRSVCVGDVNGDGIDDVIVEASGATVAVIFGKASGLTSVTWNIPGAGFMVQGKGVGGSVSGAGDVNGDGIDDFIVGAPSADPNGRDNAGAAYVILGMKSGFTTVDLASFSLDNSRGYLIQGAVKGDQLGSAVSGAGDVNGDGYADVIVGVLKAGPNRRTNAGVVYVIYGMASGFATVDLLRFVSGSRGFIIEGAAAYDYLGESVSGAGDVNGDGIDDVIVGASGARADLVDWSELDTGVAYIIFGKKSGLTTIDLATFTFGDSTGFIIQGAVTGDGLGTSVSAAGDVNGDGIDDVIVGAPYADPNLYTEDDVGSSGAENPNRRTNAGAAYVIYGKKSGFKTVQLSRYFRNMFAIVQVNLGYYFTSDDSTGFIIEGAAAGDYLGYSVSAGDVNGDGYADVIVGAYGASPNGRSAAGAAYVIYGRGSGFTTVDVRDFAPPIRDHRGYTILGAAAGDSLGVTVSAGGDVNGDGVDDVIMGAPNADPNGFSSGAAYVILSEHLPTSQPTSLPSYQPSSQPSSQPTQPSSQPTSQPTQPTSQPTSQPTKPSSQPTSQPSSQPLSQPTSQPSQPTLQPSSQPTQPTSQPTSPQQAKFLFSDIDTASLATNNIESLTVLGKAGDQLGCAVSAAGDVNGDGIDDFIVGAQYDPYPGSAY